MTIKDFLDLCLDDSFVKFEIWDGYTDNTVFSGTGCDLRESYDFELVEYEIGSWEHHSDKIVLNIWSEDL